MNPESKRYPSFQFYPKDFLSSLDVLGMKDVQIGWYCLLLFNSWNQKQQCYLPSDPEVLRKICKANRKTWNLNRSCVLNKFRTTQDGSMIYNERLLQELEKLQELSRKKAKAGTKGANLRWQNHSTAIAQPMAQPSLCQNLPMAKNGYPYAIANANAVEAPPLKEGIRKRLADSMISVMGGYDEGVLAGWVAEYPPDYLRCKLKILADRNDGNKSRPYVEKVLREDFGSWVPPKEEVLLKDKERGW